MASSRITCPDCKSVLKPAKPVPDGKKVKCPKCNNMFTTPGLVEEEERPRSSKASGGKAKAGIKKASASKPAPKKIVEDDDDDDDHGGVYGTIQEEEQRDEDKPQIEYAPDMSIKDLRGPAQAAVVRPSNYLLLIGGLSCLCDILLICISFWPMVFSAHLIDHEKFLEQRYKASGDTKAAEKIKSIPKDRKDIKDKKELEALEDAETAEYITRFSILGGYILVLIYNGIAVIGAVKLQNLESRRWGIASAIMTILPFGSLGISGLVWYVMDFLFNMVLDDPAMGMLYAGGVSLLVWIVAIVAGVWSLRTVISEEVIAGFEYVAE